MNGKCNFRSRFHGHSTITHKTTQLCPHSQLVTPLRTAGRISILGRISHMPPTFGAGRVIASEMERSVRDKHRDDDPAQQQARHRINAPRGPRKKAMISALMFGHQLVSRTQQVPDGRPSQTEHQAIGQGLAVDGTRRMKGDTQGLKQTIKDRYNWCGQDKSSSEQLIRQITCSDDDLFCP